MCSAKMGVGVVLDSRDGDEMFSDLTLVLNVLTILGDVLFPMHRVA